MIVYSLWWREKNANMDTLDNIFPNEESARSVANQILVQDNIESVSVDKCTVTEYGLQRVKTVYEQEKKPKDL